MSDLRRWDWPGQLGVQRGARQKSQHDRHEVLRIEKPLDHAALGTDLRVPLTAEVTGEVSGGDGSFLSSETRNSLSRPKSRFRDSPMTYSCVAFLRKAAQRWSLGWVSSSRRADTTLFSCIGSTFGIRAIVLISPGFYSSAVTLFFAGLPATEPTVLRNNLGGSDPRSRRRWAAAKPRKVGSLPPKSWFSPRSTPRLRRWPSASFLTTSTCNFWKASPKSMPKTVSGAFGFRASAT